ncbi:MAG: hypothetical protein KGR26_14630, partial [Cyanobacteria bacterium REEB65]|nr:hypothetical protein [Cyanobacteria bacterium REEB65]
LDRVATHILAVPAGRLLVGGYSTNAAHLVKVEPIAARSPRPTLQAVEPIKGQRFNAFKHARRLEEAEERVLFWEARTKEIAELLADPASYTTGAHDPAALAAAYEEARHQLSLANADWEALVDSSP